MSRVVISLSFFSAISVLVAAEVYCPGRDDFDIGDAHWTGQGWLINGPGGVHGKQTFNLLGGWIEFDINTSAALTGVNNNLYLVSPEPSYFNATNDCDIQGEGKPHCMEMDIIENNGDCVGQVTWHTWPNFRGSCDRTGCRGKMYRSGKSHVKAEFSEDGWMTVAVDGKTVHIDKRHPSYSVRKRVKETMTRVGAQIQSSQWVGWVPSGNCGPEGKLEGSTFSIENIRISGKVVQGSEAAKCSAEQNPSSQLVRVTRHFRASSPA